MRPGPIGAGVAPPGSARYSAGMPATRPTTTNPARTSAPTRPPRARREARLVAGLVVTAGLLGGCSLATPELSLRGADVVSRSPEGSVLEVTLVGRNGSDDPLPLRITHYTVTVGSASTRVERSAQVTLSARGEHLVRLPAALPADIADGTAYTIRGSVEFLRPGIIQGVLYDWGVWRPGVSFAFRGTVGDTAPATPPRAAR